MANNHYYHCAVPVCLNSSRIEKDKLFIQVPRDTKMRKAWFKLARRDPEQLCGKSRLYFCEDHFNLETDMENYMEYKIMGSVKRIRLIPGCIPTKFDWEIDDTDIWKAFDIEEDQMSNEDSSIPEDELAIKKCDEYVESNEVQEFVATLVVQSDNQAIQVCPQPQSSVPGSVVKEDKITLPITVFYQNSDSDTFT